MILKCDIDRITKRIQNALVTWKRLLLVNVPQFVITVIALGLYHQQLSVFTDSSQTKIQRVKLASYLIKLVLLSIDGIVLIIGALGYPCFRYYINSEVEHLQDIKPPSMRKFVTWYVCLTYLIVYAMSCHVTCTL
jgi:dTDP-4-dehydrorhamnose reductase